MSDETPARARSYPGVIKDELADLNLKLDSLIKHWADAAEMTGIMESCRATVQEAHQANYEALMTVNRQLGLLLTPVEEPAPSRWRPLLLALVALASLLLSFWLGSFLPWARGDRQQAQRRAAFVADMHTTLEQAYGHLPKAVQEQLQAVYLKHQYEPLRAGPQEKKP